MLIATCSPGYETYAFDELKKVDSSLTDRSALERGVFSVKSALPFKEISQRIQSANIIFTRHIQPVDQMFEIDRTKADFGRFIDMLHTEINRIPKNSATAIQVRRVAGVDYKYTAYGVKEALDPFLLEQEMNPAVDNPDVVISIFITQSAAYWGISKAQDNLSDWPGGAIRLRKEENQASRSRFKLEEACIVFGIPISSYVEALDLGAAPGGWTSYLLDQGLLVTAIDTGEMDPDLLKHPNLTFIKENTGEATFSDNSFDVITCDMSWDPFRTAKMVQRLAPCLRQNGVLLITIKFMHKKILKTIEEFLRILEPDFKRVRVKQLFHNRDEVTAYLIKK